MGIGESAAGRGKGQQTHRIDGVQANRQFLRCRQQQARQEELRCVVGHHECSVAASGDMRQARRIAVRAEASWRPGSREARASRVQYQNDCEAAPRP